jgi:ribosomal protein S12 methylthiotransferase accessory factor
MGVARLKTPGPGNLMLSAGCSFDPEDAIHKTLCEIASHVLSFPEIAARRMEEIQAMAKDFSLVKGLAECGLLFGLPEMAHHADFLLQNPLVQTLDTAYEQWNSQRPRHRDLLDDLHYCMEKLFELNLDVIVVEQTSCEQRASGLKTVCVIVPGLLPMDFGWERDRVLELPRLRTVPRTAGYRQTDFVPQAQTIVPHPFP